MSRAAPRRFAPEDPEVAGLPCTRPGFAPAVWPDTEGFWTAGFAGELRVWTCRTCALRVHPPAPRCRRCRGEQLAWEPVDGDGSVFAFTVNEQAWEPGLPTPYVIAIVDLVDQDGLRLTTNLVGMAPADVAIGLPVTVAFVDLGATAVPVFVPRAAV